MKTCCSGNEDTIIILVVTVTKAPKKQWKIRKRKRKIYLYTCYKLIAKIMNDFNLVCSFYNNVNFKIKIIYFKLED